MNRRILSIATMAILALGAIAVPAAAHGDEDHAADRRADRDEARGLRELHSAAHARFVEHCEDGDNLTEAEEERCERIREAHEPGHQARRAAHALLRAIEAHYERVGRLEMLEYRIEQDLADGNLSANESAALEHKLGVIEAQQNKTLERITHLEERLEALKAKWDDVAQHVAERRAQRHSDEDCDARFDEKLAEAEEERNESLAEAAAERDEVLSDPNATEEDRVEAEAEYNATVAEAEAEYDEEVAEIEADRDECRAHDEDDDEEDEVEDESEEEESEDEEEDESEDDDEEDDS